MSTVTERFLLRSDPLKALSVVTSTGLPVYLHAMTRVEARHWRCLPVRLCVGDCGWCLCLDRHYVEQCVPWLTLYINARPRPSIVCTHTSFLVRGTVGGVFVCIAAASALGEPKSCFPERKLLRTPLIGCAAPPAAGKAQCLQSGQLPISPQPYSPCLREIKTSCAYKMRCQTMFGIWSQHQLQTIRANLVNVQQ